MLAEQIGMSFVYTVVVSFCLWYAKNANHRKSENNSILVACITGLIGIADGIHLNSSIIEVVSFTLLCIVGVVSLALDFNLGGNSSGNKKQDSI